jgi:arylsulfatase A-like enzyme
MKSDYPMFNRRPKIIAAVFLVVAGPFLLSSVLSAQTKPNAAEANGTKAPAAEAPAAKMPAKRPNVLILMTDDMSRHCVGATGGVQALTPNLDAIAKRGTVMRNVVHQGGFSGAICTCSRAMILTGRSLWTVTPEQLDYRGPAQLATEDTLFPEQYRQAGWQTFGTGKWHNGNAALLRCFDHAEAITGGMLPFSKRDRGGARDNTIILFTADHGLAVGEHGLMGKQNLYDGSWRVPMILAGPGIPQGAQRKGLAYLHGLYPTLASFSGIDAPEHSKEFEFASTVRGQSQGLPAVYGAYSPNVKRNQGVRAVRIGGYKLLYYPHNQRKQLFNLTADPWEAQDLAQDPGFSVKVDQLFDSLEQWMQSSGDPLVK